MTKPWQVLDHSGEESFSYGQYLQDVFSDYIHFAECKRLINQIVAAQEKEKFKSIVVLSEFPDEGKSFLAIVLAFGYSNLLGRRVLLVDAVSQTQGRTLYLDRLLGPAGPDRKPAPGEEAQGVIDLVSTRSEGAVHLDSSDFQIGNYIESVKPRYDLVLIDTCAISTAGKANLDPAVIARHADRAVLVLTQRAVGVDLLERIKSDLNSWNVKLLGTVFNGGSRK